MDNYIPIEKEALPEQFEIDLANETYWIEVSYNQSNDFFSLDLYDPQKNPIVLGEKLVLNMPLWSDVSNNLLPAPTLIPMDESGKAEKITFENFMETTFLFIDDAAPNEDIPSLEGEDDGE